MPASQHIRAVQARELKRAVRHSWRLGRPLNRYAVIAFDTPAYGDEYAADRAFQKIRIKFRSWLDYQRRKHPEIGPITDARTWELRGSILHVNWLVHVPFGLEDAFVAKLKRWTHAVIGEHGEEVQKNKAIYNLNGLLSYVLKGTDPAHAWRVGVDPVDQGTIWGRRAVASISLGRTARERDWESGAVVNQESRWRRPGGRRQAVAYPVEHIEL